MTEPTPSSVLADASFDALYRGEDFTEGLSFERPPWDIGEPQPVLVELADSGGFSGAVLDIGCGLGDNALFLTERGYRVTGVDGSPAGLTQARERARRRGLDIEFREGDATSLDGLEQRFDSVLDSALYHCLPEESRADYAAAIRRVSNPGAALHLFCFSDTQPESVPFAVSKDDLHANLGPHWDIISIEPKKYATAFTADTFHALADNDTVTALGMTADPEHYEKDATGRILLPVWQLRALRR